MYADLKEVVYTCFFNFRTRPILFPTPIKSCLVDFYATMPVSIGKVKIIGARAGEQTDIALQKAQQYNWSNIAVMYVEKLYAETAG